MLFWNSLALFYDPMDVGNLISCSSTFSKSSLYIWKVSVHILMKPGLNDFEHSLASLWNEPYNVKVWTFFDIVLRWGCSENSISKLSLLSFPNLLAYWSSLYSTSVYSFHLFLISSASIRSLLLLSFIVPIFGWNVPLMFPIFLKRSVVFLYFFVLFTEEGLLVSPCYSLELFI